MCYFKCKRCNNSIACYGDIFAMAKGNVNANYCNPAGYIHETLTVQKTIENALQMVDRPSTDFSWFPGYSWQIAICSKCSTHVGWKFSAGLIQLFNFTFIILIFLNLFSLTTSCKKFKTKNVLWFE
jgi:cereblon